MKKAQNVVVYIRASDMEMLQRQVLHTDPATWVRGLVRHALDKMREKEEDSERVRRSLAGRRDAEQA
jgi:hypothetical protein